MVHLEISTWTWGKVCHFQNLSPVLEIHVHESSWTAIDNLTTFFRKNKVKKIEFRTHDLQTVGYAYIYPFVLRNCTSTFWKICFIVKESMSQYILHPWLALYQVILISFPNSRCFISKKKKLSNNRVKITLIFEIFGPIQVFHYQCVVHIL